MRNTISGVYSNSLSQNRTVNTTLNTYNNVDNANSDFAGTFNQRISSSINYNLRNVPTGRSSINNSVNNIASNNIYNNNTNNDDVSNDLYLNNTTVNSIVENNIHNSDTEIKVEIKAKDANTKTRIYNAVKKASETYNVDANLILAVIQKESAFNPNATSKVGAKGLMQIMPANFKYLGVKDAYNIEDNINGGTKLLREYLDKYNNNVEMALMAYNGGPGNMSKRGVKSASDLYKMPTETQKYVPAVMKIYKGA